MENHSREDVRRFVIDCRAEERRLRPFGAMEENLWDLAEASPFEQTRIITTNEKVLADPYLMRVYLTPAREDIEGQLRGLGVPPAYAALTRFTPRPYLHYFFRGDDDRAYHNHPWQRAFSLILVGGYLEHRWSFTHDLATSRLFLPGNVNYLKRNSYHRVELLPGQKCWTLFVSMGRVAAKDGTDWDFYEPEIESFTPWGQWTNEMARRRPYPRVGDLVTVMKPGDADRLGIFSPPW
jgi:hypothetical protein